MSEGVFWHLMAGLLLALGAVAALTAGLLRVRRQAWRVPLAYAALAVAAAALLFALVR